VHLQHQTQHCKPNAAGIGGRLTRITRQERVPTH
jgi:hypothetical protein